MKWIEGGAALNIVFLALAVAGIVSSIYFYVRGKREKRLVYNIRTFPLIRENIGTVPGLSIAFGGKPVSTLSLTRLAVWNAGAETITRADLVASDPLRVRGAEQGDLLAAQVSFIRRSATNLAARVEANTVYLSFDFLDQGDGGIIDIYHCGTQTFDVLGIILGCRSILVGDPTVVGERKANRLLRFLPDPDQFKYIGLLVFIIYMPFLMIAIAPLIFSTIYSKLFRKVPKEYSLE